MSQSQPADPQKTDDPLPPAVKAIGLAMLIPMSLVPIGVGLTVLAFLWLGSDKFGGPPLFFKIFGSFVALGFVGFGAIPLIGAIYGRSAAAGLKDKFDSAQSGHQAGPAKTFVCPHCSAPIADLSEVAPTGDVRCAFCHSLFNTRA